MCVLIISSMIIVSNLNINNYIYLTHIHTIPHTHTHTHKRASQVYIGPIRLYIVTVSPLKPCNIIVICFGNDFNQDQPKCTAHINV